MATAFRFRRKYFDYEGIKDSIDLTNVNSEAILAGDFSCFCCQEILVFAFLYFLFLSALSKRISIANFYVLRCALTAISFNIMPDWSGNQLSSWELFLFGCSAKLLEVSCYQNVETK